jgi:alcohol dehydrogenase
MILGHEIVGRVVEAGHLAAQRYQIAPGDRVIVESSIPCWSCEACRSGAYTLCPQKGGYGTRLGTDVEPGLWGGMAELLYIAPGSILHRIPPDMPAEVALCVPILANALHWVVRRGGLAPGDRILIQGCGPQGLAAALVATRAGASEVVVTGLVRDSARLSWAAAVGARTVVVEPEASHPSAEIGAGYDLVLDVSGSPDAIAQAPDYLRPRGTFVLAGLAGKDVTARIATDRLVWREIRIQGVLSKDESAIRSALAMVLADGELARRLGSLVTHVFPLARAMDAVRAVDGGLDGFVKAAVRPA